jgi:hypothetical protein
MIAADPSEESNFPIKRRRVSAVERETAEQPSVPETPGPPSLRPCEPQMDASHASNTSLVQRKGEPVSEETAEQPSVPETVEYGKRGQDSRRCIGGEQGCESVREGEPISEETAQPPSVPETAEQHLVLRRARLRISERGRANF